MFETSWFSVIVLAAVVFFIAYQWQKSKEDAYRKSDEARGLKHTPETAKYHAKEAALATLLIVVGLLLLGVIRIEGATVGCSYNRYEGPDACYDQY